MESEILSLLEVCGLQARSLLLKKCSVVFVSCPHQIHGVLFTGHRYHKAVYKMERGLPPNTLVPRFRLKVDEWRALTPAVQVRSWGVCKGHVCDTWHTIFAKRAPIQVVGE